MAYKFAYVIFLLYLCSRKGFALSRLGILGSPVSFDKRTTIFNRKRYITKYMMDFVTNSQFEFILTLRIYLGIGIVF